MPVTGFDAGSPTLPPRIRTLLGRVHLQPTPLPVPAARLQPGKLTGLSWGGMEVGELVGHGGMGEVYRARQAGTGRAIALKVMHPGAITSEPLRRLFDSEARATALVRSPHIPRVYACGEFNRRPWVAFEYLEGETLDQALRKRLAVGRGFSPDEAVALITQAAAGLSAVHHERLIHRDLKPANLLLASDGILKVTDFGLARFLDQPPNSPGQVLGTPRYMAPEQGRGLEADARSDVYSLGVVLYELLTGRPPFDGDTAEALIFQHNFIEPIPPARRNPRIPTVVQSVCLTCLRKDPAQRYATAELLARDLQHCRASPTACAAGTPAPMPHGDGGLPRTSWSRPAMPLPL